MTFFRILQKLCQYDPFCEWKQPHTVIEGQPSVNNELISQAEQWDANSQPKNVSRNGTMHSELQLDNRDPQCRLQMATSPPLVAYCY